MPKVFRNILIVVIILGAFGKGIVQSYYSSGVPDPGSGRTVATSGTDGETIYVTQRTERLSWVVFGLCAAIGGCWAFWPEEKKATRALPLDSVSQPTAKMLSYEWQPRKWKRYGMTIILVSLTVYVWIRQFGAPGWWPRIITSAIGLWSFRLLIDYRMSIDTEKGIFLSEKFLLGRYRIGASKVPLSEFTAVVLDHHEDTDDRSLTFYVCLKHRTGRLRQIRYFDAREGRTREDADKVARELSGATQLQYEETV